jgi:hypothetical protein
MSTLTLPIVQVRPDRGKVGMASLIIAESAIFTIFVVAYLFYTGKSLSGSLGDSGGQRGPTLDSVALRLTQDQRPPGDPGRWQHAGVRQESQPGGDYRARRISRNPASGGTGARAQPRPGAVV